MVIAFHKLTTKNLAALAQRVIYASKNGAYQAPAGNELLQKLEKESGEYDKVYVKQTYSGKGHEVKKADTERTDLYCALRSYLRSYSLLTMLLDAAEAGALHQLMQRFDLRQLTYAAKTAQLEKLLKELQQPAQAEHLSKLHLTPAFDELRARHLTFETLFAEQAEANAALRAMPSATAQRRQLEGALRDYLRFLTAMRSDAAWAPLYAEINELVKAAAIAYKNDRKTADKAPHSDS